MSRWGFLFGQWLRRDLAGRYRGSMLGLLWLLLQPMAQITVFTLIFHGFMQVRWPIATGAGSAAGTPDAWMYALQVFAGLSVFNFFAEVLGRAPSAVLSQPNLVTKVRFPLMLLPAVTVGTALVHVGIGVGVLLIAGLATRGLTLQVLWLPLWLLPVLLYGAGLAVLLAGLGVYVRDIAQAVPAVTGLLMFLTPIFYPLSAVPQHLHAVFAANPLAWAAESLRAVMLEARGLAATEWALHLLASAALAVLATWVFRRLERGFADVL